MTNPSGERARWGLAIAMSIAFLWPASPAMSREPGKLRFSDGGLGASKVENAPFPPLELNQLFPIDEGARFGKATQDSTVVSLLNANEADEVSANFTMQTGTLFEILPTELMMQWHNRPGPGLWFRSGEVEAAKDDGSEPVALKVDKAFYTLVGTEAKFWIEESENASASGTNDTMACTRKGHVTVSDEANANPAPIPSSKCRRVKDGRIEPELLDLADVLADDRYTWDAAEPLPGVSAGQARNVVFNKRIGGKTNLTDWLRKDPKRDVATGGGDPFDFASFPDTDLEDAMEDEMDDVLDDVTDIEPDFPMDPEPITIPVGGSETPTQ